MSITKYGKRMPVPDGFMKGRNPGKPICNAIRPEAVCIAKNLPAQRPVRRARYTGIITVLSELRAKNVSDAMRVKRVARMTSPDLIKRIKLSNVTDAQTDLHRDWSLRV